MRHPAPNFRERTGEFAAYISQKQSAEAQREIRRLGKELTAIGNNGDMSKGKGRMDRMISYEPLWETMKKRGATTYALQVKGEISNSTIRRLKANESVSTNTLVALCKILDCDLNDVIAYLPEPGEPE